MQPHSRLSLGRKLVIRLPYDVVEALDVLVPLLDSQTLQPGGITRSDVIADVLRRCLPIDLEPWGLSYPLKRTDSDKS